MMNVLNYLKARFASKKGQGMVEYGLIIAAIAVIVISAVAFLKVPLENLFKGIGTYLTGKTPV
jgi:pilus assembly protein Flp/PilA